MIEAQDQSWPKLLDSLLRRDDLSAEQARWALRQVMDDALTPSQIAGFLMALRAKGETAIELTAFVEEAYAHATTIEVSGPTVDLVGTGGDGAKTVNISTMGAIVAAAAGARVVKHGSRSASSASGSADVLEQLGIALHVPVQLTGAVVDEVGIAFCFAAHFHPAMRYAAKPRRELGVPTVFNLLGPLTNPARPTAQAVGVADARLAPIIADVLARRDVTALVYRGDDGLDELTVTTTSTVWVVSRGIVRREIFDPRSIGIGLSEISQLRGADAARNAEVAREVLGGKPGAVRDAVLLAAASALAALHPTEDSVTVRLGSWLEVARKAIDSGAAKRVLDTWATTTQRLSVPR